MTPEIGTEKQVGDIKDRITDGFFPKCMPFCLHYFFNYLFSEYICFSQLFTYLTQTPTNPLAQLALPGTPSYPDLAIIKNMTQHAFAGYQKFAWGRDELTPVSGGARDWVGGFGMFLHDVFPNKGRDLFNYSFYYPILLYAKKQTITSRCYYPRLTRHPLPHEPYLPVRRCEIIYRDGVF